MRIEGVGPATCIVNLNQEGKPALIVQPPDWEKNPKARLWRVQWANLRICGDPEAKDAATTNPARGVLLRGTRDILVSGNSFSGLLEHAIHADDQCRRIFVVGNLTVDCHRQTQGQGEPLQLGPAENHRQEGNMLVPPQALEQDKPPEEKPKEKP